MENAALGSVGKALRVLNLLREHGTLRVSDTARELGVARSNAHRLLVTLQAHGFTEQDPTTKAYGPGPALLDLASWAGEAGDRHRTAMQEVSSQLGETVNLVVLRGAEILFVDCIESGRPVRVGSRVGQAMPAHCTSGGKALLAERETKELRRLFPSEKLPGLTPASITSRQALEIELARVRSVGVATNEGESESDVYAAAVALSRTTAITVSIPLSRVDAARAGEIAAVLKAVARR